MRGRVQAAGFAGVSGLLALFLPPLSYLSGATIGLVTLRMGVRETFSVIALSALIVGVASYLATGTPWPALVLILALWLPAAVCALVLRYTRSQSALLLTAGAFAVLLALGLRVFTGDVTVWWGQWLDHVLAQSHVHVSQSARSSTLTVINGVVASSMGLSFVLMVLIARWWQAALYNPGGFRAEFHALRLPRLLAVPVLLAVAVLAVTGVQAAGPTGALLDVLFVATMVYMFQGLAVAHGYVAARKLSVGWLVALYVGVFLAPPYAVMLLAAVGLSDAALDYRARAAGHKGA